MLNLSLSLFFLFLLASTNLLAVLDDSTMIRDFKNLSKSIKIAIDGDKEAFSELPITKLMSLFEEEIKIKVGEDLKVIIDGKSYDKALVNYSLRSPKEIHIDRKDWESISKSESILCVVLHEYLSILGKEDYLYEITGKAKFCSKLNYAVVNFVWQKYTLDQDKVDRIFNIGFLEKSYSDLRGDKKAKFKVFFPQEPQVDSSLKFIAYDNEPQVAQLRSQVQCMKHLCDKFQKTKCSNPEGFQEKNQLCSSWWNEFPKLYGEYCESLGLKAWCNINNHQCVNSGLVRQAVYYSCIGPLSISEQ